MPTPLTSELPKPKDWDEFEDIVWDIYARKWNDPHAQRYGRTGQRQQGVDVYGRPAEFGGRHVGVQCKRYEPGRLTQKVVEDEIAKAEGFVPPLAEFIIATTDNRDATLQEAVRVINQEREKAAEPAKSFTVRIVFWEDLSHDLAEPSNEDLLRKYYGPWLRFLVDCLERGDFDHSPIERASLRQVFDPLLENRMALFGGRELALATIAAFVRQAKGGYLMITAPPGFGKTALMAKLVSDAPEAFAYHFFTPLYFDDSLSETSFLSNVVQQVAQWHGHTEELPDQLSELRALFHRFITRPLEKTQVLILDGLDEVTRWELAPYLSRRLPENLHVILTTRDVGQDWLAQYKLPADQVAPLHLGRLSREEVAEVLRAAGGGAVAFADDPALLAEIVRVAAYQVDENLGADPFYVRLLAEDALAGRLTPANVADRPQGLDRYLDEWMEATLALADEEGEYTEAVQDLLGTLIVVLGPINRADLEGINLGLRTRGLARVFPKVIKQVRRFVVGDDENGYALVHPRLRWHMRGHKDLDLEVYSARLLTYCASWQEHHSRYALTHYAAHLADVGRVDDLYKLISKPWMEAKLDVFQSHEPFAEDVTLAIEAAESETLVRWEQLVRGCLIAASLGSMATQAPSEVLGVLVQTGDAEQLIKARGYAPLIQDRTKQCAAYRLIGKELFSQGKTGEAQMVFAQALAVAQAIEYERDRANALSGVAQALAATEQNQQALNAFLEAFKSARLAGRASTFAVLGQAAPTLAGIDGGQTLWRVCQEVMEVEGWWGT